LRCVLVTFDILAPISGCKKAKTKCPYKASVEFKQYELLKP